MSDQDETTPVAAAPAEEKPAPAAEAPAEKAEEKVQENGTGDAAEAAQPEPETPKDMRAIVLTGFGGLKTVKVMKKPEPTLSEGEVLIRVKAW